MRFYHANHNVVDLEGVIGFYEEYFGLKVDRRFDESDQTLVFLVDGSNNFCLELTKLKGREKPYDVGETPFHLAFYCDNYAEVYARHKAENRVVESVDAMRLHFIKDPEGYLIEILDSDRSNLG